jgi:uncharacterized protein (TIGR03435 family)
MTIGAQSDGNRAPSNATRLERALTARGPAFETASVKRNVGDPPGMTIRTLPGGGFFARNVPLKNLIRRAFGLQIYQVEGGPPWMASERFNVEARAGRDLPYDSPEIMLMLRSLLMERFALLAHAEIRQLDTYVLRVARADRRLGKGLRKSSIDCDAILSRAPVQREAPVAVVTSAPPRNPSVPDCSIRVSDGIRVDGVTIAKLAEYLQPDVGRIVVDETGLSGTFDVDLPYEMNPGRFSPSGDAQPALRGASILVAVQEQLGLRLETRRGPVEVLVVDSAQLPSAN